MASSVAIEEVRDITLTPRHRLCLITRFIDDDAQLGAHDARAIITTLASTITIAHSIPATCQNPACNTQAITALTTVSAATSTKSTANMTVPQRRLGAVGQSG
jgi:hypothetical protein